MATAPSTNRSAERLDRLLAPLPAHRAPQPLGLPHAEPRERDRDLEHLVLEDDDAVRLAERLGEQRMVDRRDEARILAQALAVLDVRMDGLPLDRPRPDERDLHREVVEVLRPRTQQALHLRAALDLEVADRVGALDLVVHVRIVERDAGEVDRLALRLGDLDDAVLDRGEHPEPEQVDLQEAGVGARVLVPLADLTALHRGRLHRDELDERTAGDDHPARVLRDVARKAGDLAGERAEGAPAAGAELRLAVGELRDLLLDSLRVPLGDAGEPLELGERQAQRLAEVADRSARAVGREAGDERGVLVAVALGERDDQLLADVAREVEVDVRHRVELAVQKAPERQAGRHGIHVREPGQVADERADRAAPPTPGRQRMAWRSRPRTSRATSAASSSTSQWSRKNPASPRSPIRASSSSSRARAFRLWPLASP